MCDVSGPAAQARPSSASMVPSGENIGGNNHRPRPGRRARERNMWGEKLRDVEEIGWADATARFCQPTCGRETPEPSRLPPREQGLEGER